MTGTSIVIDWGGEPIELLADRAALLRRHRTALIADLHLGKARAFRQQGLPVPCGTTRETLMRLDALVSATRAEHIVFLGDLLHSRHAQGSAALDEFARWRAAHASLALTLVRGNHDAHAGDPPRSLGIDVVEEPFPLGGLALCHHPEAPAARATSSRMPAMDEPDGGDGRVESGESGERDERGLDGASAPVALRGGPAAPARRAKPGRSFMADALEFAVDATAREEADFGWSGAKRSLARVADATPSTSPGSAAGLPRIAGHLHPCHTVAGRGDRLRLPCFHFTERVAVLPAFGAFTGMHAVRRVEGDRVWVVVGDDVVAVPGR